MRSIRPRVLSGPAQRATRLLGTLGRSGPGELAAFLEGVDEAEVLSAAPAVPPLDLVNAAYGIFITAHEISQTCTRDQRAKLRGCSTRLVALALEQAVLLDNMTRELAERERAQEEAKHQLAVMRADVETQCVQARSLLKKVAPEDVAAQLAVAPTPFDPVWELDVLATIAREVLHDAPPNVATRSRLYGIDQEFVTGLERLADELRANERKAEGVPFTEEQVGEARRAHVATLMLAQHFIETFAAARAVDKAIPAVAWPAKKAPGAPLSEARPRPAHPSGTHAAVHAPAAAPPSATPLQLLYFQTR